MAWAEPEFTAQRVNTAGKVLLRAWNQPFHAGDDWDEYWQALAVINNFRGSHAYPLNTFQVGLRNICRRFDSKDPVVAQRIKRLYSIYHKLDRFPKMKLSQIQDIGGCRAILSDAKDVIQVHEYYEKKSAIKHALATTDDYIAKPKGSGYRGIHLVYRYFSDKQKQAYNGLKIEIQLRSRYQHAWATAVETVSMFSGQALKSSLGSQDWQRFFALMSGAIAWREGLTSVPDVPASRNALRSELLEYARKLHVEDRLQGYRSLVNTFEMDSQGAHYFLLQLDPGSGTLNVTGFGANQVEEAARSLSNAEQEVKDKPGTDAVLVSVESINALANAYPNYFADTRLFEQLLSQTLVGRSRGLRVPNLALKMMPGRG